MIHTSKQLKDKVRDLSKGDNDIAKTLIRNFVMERFLERVSLSVYRESLILKGGMLIASIMGVDMRATMDIDTTVKALPLNEDAAQRIVSEICKIPVDDGVSFHITSIAKIMAEHEYPGIRMVLQATLDRMRQTIKLDLSTDDVITPAAISYKYKRMFEDRVILLRTYNKETLLAEKIQTILARGIANTRLRDFYDVYVITKKYIDELDKEILLESFHATCRKRETVFTKEDMAATLTQIREDAGIAQMWERFRKKNYFVGTLEWEVIAREVLQMIHTYIIQARDDVGDGRSCDNLP